MMIVLRLFYQWQILNAKFIIFCVKLEFLRTKAKKSEMK